MASSDVDMLSSDNESVAQIEGLDDDPNDFLYDEDDLAAFDDSEVDEMNLDGADATIDEDELDTLDQPKRKPWEVEYISRNEQDITDLQKKEVDQIAAMFNVKDTDAAILLRHMNWNKERLIERYMDAPDEVKYEAGVIDDPTRPRVVNMTAIDDFTCEVCYASTSDLPPLTAAQAELLRAYERKNGNHKEQGTTSSSYVRQDHSRSHSHLHAHPNSHHHPHHPTTQDPFIPRIATLALACGHRYCTDCYTEYLNNKIKNEGESRRVQCMEESCKLIIDENTIGQLVSPSILERYRALLNRGFVSDSGMMAWCPAPGCELAVECHVGQKKLNYVVPTVKCSEGHEFCFGCGNDGHAPCICRIVKLWLKKCADDSETSNWIKANTQDCPNPGCNSLIEKNGGCNHMTCRKCKYEFCWICEGPWSEHGNSYYNCNRFDEKKAQEKESRKSSRVSLERYLHYFNRYQNHEQSARLDEKLMVQTRKNMDAMQEAGVLSWSEVQFLGRAAAVVNECRMTLKWTYAMAFYLQRNNMTEIFEDNQRDLERAVEELSEQLQSRIDQDTITQLRQKVTDLMVYVQRRREIMLGDTLQGYPEGRWEFTV